MTYERRNKGTCSVMTKVELNPDHTIESVEVLGGCNGNLKGICQLLKGMKAEDAIERMKGTLCGSKPTSCPDQIAITLEEALKNEINLETSSAYDIHIINALYESGLINKDMYIVCNGFKRPQYVENIANLINSGFTNTIPVIDNKQELDLLDIIEKPWNGWNALAKRYLRMYSSFVAKYSP